MSDFTLLIPTFNRPRHLQALLRHLEGHKVQWPILVLDSSETPSTLKAELDINQIIYPSHMHPFDKFCSGAYEVRTEFCALCADDDVVFPAGIELCLEELRNDRNVAAAHGWDFAFLADDSKIHNIRKRESITDPDPLRRLGQLFNWYVAITYSCYRANILRYALGKAGLIANLMSKELLSGALAAIAGKMITVPHIVSGRSVGTQVQSYRNWHPLEWLVNDADPMFIEFTHLRHIIEETLLSAVDRGSVRRAVNLMFMRYFLQHCSQKVLTFFIDNRTNDIPKEIHDEVIELPQRGAPLYAPTQEQLAFIGENMKYYRLESEEAPDGQDLQICGADQLRDRAGDIAQEPEGSAQETAGGAVPEGSCASR